MSGGPGPQGRAGGAGSQPGRPGGSPAPAAAGRAPRWAAPLLFVVLLGGFAAGIWGTYREVFPGKGLHRVSGVFSARLDERTVLVAHEQVPGLMDEMAAMVFPAASPGLLDEAELRPGDRIRLTLRETPGELLIVEIRKIQ